MNFCTNCGSRLNPTGPCPECGVQPPQSNQMPPQQTYQNQNYHYSGPVDNGSAGWGLLGFCIPIVGLVLYLVWKDTQPLNAKSAGTGALVSVLITLAFYMFFIIFALINFLFHLYSPL